jgi:aspartate aminotransferase
MPDLAAHARSMPRSGIREVMDLAWSLDGEIIGLHVGEPSFATPRHVLDGAREALARGETRYVPNAGIPELRQAIADKVVGYNRIHVSADNVIVTAGGMQALFNALTMTVSTGDDVLVPDPGWPNFVSGSELLQARPVRYPLRRENGFLPDVGDLEAVTTERTAAVIVNSPSNPVGAVLDERTAAGLVSFAERHDLWIISDECYDAITFDVPHVSPAAVASSERVLSCFSFSKTYAMTGMRVGYLVVPPSVAPVAAKLQEPMLACVNAPAQRAALAGLRGSQEVVETMRSAYQERRDQACALLDQLGLPYLRPQGAFYLWVDVRDRCGDEVQKWALELLRHQRVALAPGTAFGPSGEGWARLSLAAETDELLEGCRRIAEFSG